MIRFFKKFFQFFFISKYGKTQRVSRKSKLYACHLGENISIGEFCYMQNVQLGSFSYVSKNVTIMNTIVGKFCSIGQGTVIAAGMHPTRKFVSTSPVFFSPFKQCGTTFSDSSYFREMGETIIGNDVWIGANVIIIDDVVIGDGAIIGAGAIVTKNVEPYSIVVGNPAKHIRYRFDLLEVEFLLKFKWWNKDERWLKNNYKDFHNIVSFTNKYNNN